MVKWVFPFFDMKLFCKHQWKLISDKTFKSKFEHANDVLGGCIKGARIPHQMSCAERKNVQICACEKCGKLKRFVTDL